MRMPPELPHAFAGGVSLTDTVVVPNLAKM